MLRIYPHRMTISSLFHDTWLIYFLGYWDYDIDIRRFPNVKSNYLKLYKSRFYFRFIVGITKLKAV